MSDVRIELNHDGIRTLLRSEEMKQVVEAEASRVQQKLGEGYEVSSYTGPGRVNASVSAVTAEAKRDNMQNNTILKALQ